MKTSVVRFRIASLGRNSTVWLSHVEGFDIEMLDLRVRDIRDDHDRFHQKQWEIQSSVDDGLTWQTQRYIGI